MSVNDYQVISCIQNLYARMMEEKLNRVNEYLGNMLKSLQEKQTNSSNNQDYLTDLCEAVGYYITTSQFVLNYFAESMNSTGKLNVCELGQRMTAAEKSIAQDSIALGYKMKAQNALLFPSIQNQIDQFQYEYLYNQIYLDILIDFVAFAGQEPGSLQIIQAAPLDLSINSIIDFTEKNTRRFFSQN